MIISMVDSSKHREKAKNRGNPESMTRSRLRSYLNQNILKWFERKIETIMITI